MFSTHVFSFIISMSIIIIFSVFGSSPTDLRLFFTGIRERVRIESW